MRLIERQCIAGDSQAGGGGKLDTAMLVEDALTMKKGFLIVHGTTDEQFLLGAGTGFGHGGDNFFWMDEWRVLPPGGVGIGVDVSDPPLLQGDAHLIGNENCTPTPVFGGRSVVAFTPTEHLVSMLRHSELYPVCATLPDKTPL